MSGLTVFSAQHLKHAPMVISVIRVLAYVTRQRLPPNVLTNMVETGSLVVVLSVDSVSGIKAPTARGLDLAQMGGVWSLARAVRSLMFASLLGDNSSRLGQSSTVL